MRKYVLFGIAAALLALGVAAALLVTEPWKPPSEKLLAAVWDGDVAAARKQLARGAKLYEFPYKEPLLHRAIATANLEMTQLLLDHGADPNDFKTESYSDPDWQRTPLVAAIQLGRHPIANLLLDRGADAGRAARGTTPLHAAANRIDLELIARLAKAAPATLEARDERGKTPLMIGADHYWEAYDPIFEAFVRAGASPNEWPVLSRSATSATRLRMLLDAGASARAASPLTGETLLHLAASSGVEANVELLVARGAAVDALSSRGVRPLTTALCRGHEKAALALLAHGASPDPLEGEWECPLAVAVRSGVPKLVTMILAKGAHPERCPELLARVLRTPEAEAGGADFVLPSKLPDDVPQKLQALAEKAGKLSAADMHILCP